MSEVFEIDVPRSLGTRMNDTCLDNFRTLTVCQRSLTNYRGRSLTEKRVTRYDNESLEWGTLKEKRHGCESTHLYHSLQNNSRYNQRTVSLLDG